MIQLLKYVCRQTQEDLDSGRSNLYDVIYQVNELTSLLLSEGHKQHLNSANLTYVDEKNLSENTIKETKGLIASARDALQSKELSPEGIVKIIEALKYLRNKHRDRQSVQEKEGWRGDILRTIKESLGNGDLAVTDLLILASQIDDLLKEQVGTIFPDRTTVTEKPTKVTNPKTDDKAEETTHHLDSPGNEVPENFLVQKKTEADPKEVLAQKFQASLETLGNKNLDNQEMEEAVNSLLMKIGVSGYKIKNVDDTEREYIPLGADAKIDFLKERFPRGMPWLHSKHFFDKPLFFKWSLFKNKDLFAIAAHGQTLYRIAQREGLAASEVISVLAGIKESVALSRLRGNVGITRKASGNLEVKRHNELFRDHLSSLLEGPTEE